MGKAKLWVRHRPMSTFVGENRQFQNRANPPSQSPESDRYGAAKLQDDKYRSHPFTGWLLIVGKDDRNV